MPRKITDGPVRNKERTKANLITAVAKVLEKNGFAGLSARCVADEAQVDRRLIYGTSKSAQTIARSYLSIVFNTHERV